MRFDLLTGQPIDSHNSIPLNASPPSILLTYDDEDDRYLIREALRLTGLDMQISEASNGSDALETIRSMPELPSLVDVDMNMPVMSGIETIAQIRRLQPGTPVILLTTSSRAS